MDQFMISLGFLALDVLVLGGVGGWQKHKLEKREAEERNQKA